MIKLYKSLDSLSVNGIEITFRQGDITLEEVNGLKSWRVEASEFHNLNDIIIEEDRVELSIIAEGKEYSGEAIPQYYGFLGTGRLYGYND